MQLNEFSPTDAAAVAAYTSVENACFEADSPWVQRLTPRSQELRMVHGWDGEPGRYFLGRDDDGVPVVAAALHTSEYDNRDAAWLGLDVHPDHRRRRHGTTALGLLEHDARAMGRTLAGSDAWDAPAVHGFAKVHGYDARAVEVNRRMVLAEVDPAVVEAAYDDAAAHADDYEVVRITSRTPDELQPALAAALGAINDAPRDGLELEDEVFTVDRLGAYEEAQLAREYRLYRVLARHRGTGEVGGHTVVAVDAAEPQWGEQHDTSVVRAHRGHRLGLLLKADMVRWLAEVEPQLASIDTWNARSNDHMIAVNERLGYRVLGQGVAFQRRLDG